MAWSDIEINKEAAGKKLVFLSTVATPAQVKFCYALQPYFDTEFWFCEHPDRTRGKWWRINLGDKCRIFPKVFRIKGAGYVSFRTLQMLREFNPDIIMLGGLSFLNHYLAYLWGISDKKKIVLLTERSRNPAGQLRSYGLAWRLLRWLYRGLDLVITTADDIVPQFRDEFKFGAKVVAGRYSADLDTYFSHRLRERRDAYTYLFANRLTEIYNPIRALEVFSEISRRYPGSRLLMNASGELGDRCRALVRVLELAESVEFLTGISSWDQLHEVYARSDILLLPAQFSNGNFTILEAMASGMGIVISNQILGIGNIIEDSVNGFRCDPSKEAFIERIERYIIDPTLFLKHAEINRPLVRPLSTDGTARFFSKLLNSRLHF